MSWIGPWWQQVIESLMGGGAGPGIDVVGRSFTAPPPGGPYQSTALLGGADYSGPVRISGGNPMYNVTSPSFGIGMSGANTGAQNLAAFTAALNVWMATGGDLYIPPGIYHINGLLPAINFGASLKGGKIIGGGRGFTQLIQDAPNTDIFQIGATDAERIDYLSVEDLYLLPTRYGFNLNNCLHCSFERLAIQSGISGFFLQGQNENHSFKRIDMAGMTGRCFDMKGNPNGGSNPSFNFPENSKMTFEGLRLATQGPWAIDIDAGIYLGAQQTSGGIHFRGVWLESCSQGGIRMGACTEVVLDMLAVEPLQNADNVYVMVLQDAGYSGFLTLRDCNIVGLDGGSRRSKYGFQQLNGYVLIEGGAFGVNGASGTADIQLGGNGGLLLQPNISSSAALTFSGLAREQSVLINVRGSNGLPITVVGTVAAATSLHGSGGTGNNFESLYTRSRIVNDVALAPTPTAGAQAGGSPPAPTLGVGSNDQSGQINAGTGGAPAAGELVVVTLAESFQQLFVTLVPLNAASQALNAYVTGKTANKFSISVANAPAANQVVGTYQWDYHVLGR